MCVFIRTSNYDSFNTPLLAAGFFINSLTLRNSLLKTVSIFRHTAIQGGDSSGTGANAGSVH